MTKPTVEQAIRAVEVKAKKRAARRELLDTFKEMRGCADCGTWTAPLHFDHLPHYEKEFSVSVECMRAWDVLIAEIAKCEVCCEVCHAARGWERRRREQ